MDADGSNQREVAHTHRRQRTAKGPPVLIYLGGLAWSPDGESLSYFRLAGIGRRRAYRPVRLGCRRVWLDQAVRRTRGQAVCQQLGVVAVRRADSGLGFAVGKPQLLAVNSDGSGVHVLVDREIDDPWGEFITGSLAWSPYGTRIWSEPALVAAAPCTW